MDRPFRRTCKQITETCEIKPAISFTPVSEKYASVDTSSSVFDWCTPLWYSKRFDKLWKLLLDWFNWLILVKESYVYLRCINKFFSPLPPWVLCLQGKRKEKESSDIQLKIFQMLSTISVIATVKPRLTATSIIRSPRYYCHFFFAAWLKPPYIFL